MLFQKSNQLIYIILMLTLFIWVSTLALTIFCPILLTYAVLSYLFGLKHGFDVDHIAAIDNLTRQAITKKKQINVGLYFSAGHASIVFIITFVLLISVKVFKQYFTTFLSVMNQPALIITNCLLLLIAGMNVMMLLVNKQPKMLTLRPRGFLFKLLNHTLRPSVIFMIGALFGIGFDTASEIALLGLTTIHTLQQDAIYLVLLYPLLFAAGMCLVDTLSSTLFRNIFLLVMQDRWERYHYNFILTAFTIIAAVIVISMNWFMLLSVDTRNSLTVIHRIMRHSGWLGGAIMGISILLFSCVIIKQNKRVKL